VRVFACVCVCVLVRYVCISMWVEAASDNRGRESELAQVDARSRLEMKITHRARHQRGRSAACGDGDDNCQGRPLFAIHPVIPARFLFFPPVTVCADIHEGKHRQGTLFQQFRPRVSKGFFEANEQEVEAGGVGVNSQSRGNPPLPSLRGILKE